MEPDNPDDRPESPKKKIRPSSTTNSEVSNSDATDSAGTSGLHIEINGCAAPTRHGRFVEASSSSELSNSIQTTNGPSSSNPLPPPATNSNQQNQQKVSSIQEEEVSSSENTVSQPRAPVQEQDPDWLTNEAEVLSRSGERASEEEGK